MSSVNNMIMAINKTGCTITEVSTPKNLTYIAFNKSYVDDRLAKYAKNRTNPYYLTQIFNTIYNSKRNIFCPSVIRESDQLFKVEKVYALNINTAFCDKIIEGRDLDLDSLSTAVSDILGKQVFIISPVAYYKDYKLWGNGAIMQYFNGVTQVYLVSLDDLTPTKPVTDTKRAESIYKKRKNREADKKLFDTFFKPTMKEVLDEAGFYYDDHTKKVYTNSLKFTRWINKFVETEVISKLREAGIDANINPKGYYSGSAYPITIKGIDKKMLKQCAQQIEGEQDDQ